MKSEKFWKILVVFLVALNMATLGFMVFNKPENQHHKPDDNLIVKGLHLDKEQEEAFFQLKNQHHHDMDSLNKIESEMRELVIKEIQKGEGNDSLLNGQLQSMAEIKYTKDQITLLHFKYLYQLLREDQKPYYAETIEKLAKGLMMGGRKPKPRD
jgi:hypothetical protein